MADEEEREVEETEESTISPAELLKKVHQQAKINRILMIAVISLSVLVTSTLGVGVYVMLDKIVKLESANETEDQNKIDKQFAVLEERLMLLADFRRSELKKIKKYTQSLTKLTEDCSPEKIEPFIGYLTEREGDFQKTVDIISDGSKSLARMNRGSKQWLKGYESQLDEIKKASETRQKQLESLL